MLKGSLEIMKRVHPEKMENVGSDKTLTWLLFMFGIIGTFFNFTLLHTFYEQPSFHCTDFVFLALMMSSDFFMTFGGFTLWSISIDVDNNYLRSAICRMGYLCAVTSVFWYSWFSAFASLEQFCRMLNREATLKIFNTHRIIFITVLIGITSFTTAYVGTIDGLYPDFCTLAHDGNSSFRSVTGYIFFVIPCCLTTTLQVACVIAISVINKETHYKSSQLYKDDRIQIIINILAFITFLLMWAPYILNVWPYNDNDNAFLYAAIGMFRSCFASLYYYMNSKISEASADIITYKCCSENIYKRHRRHRRGTNYFTPGENASFYLRPMVIHDPVMVNTGTTVTEV